MTTVSLQAPPNVGTRDLVRAWLTSALPLDIADSVVEVDLAPLRAPTPSFLDEVVKVVLVDGAGKGLKLLNASARATTLAAQSAENRHVKDRVQVIPQPAASRRWIDRLRNAAS